MTQPSPSPSPSPSVSVSDQAQVDRANESGKTPVVFVHGLWLLGSSWARWAPFFEAAGYVAVAPGWPGEPPDVAAARANPELFAGTGIADIADYQHAVIDRLTTKPALVGHSFGGLLVQILAGRGLSFATVAIDPAPSRGILPLPISALKSASAVLRNPANRGRAVSLTYEQFRYGFANAVTEDEAHALYDEFHVAGAGKPVFQAAAANFNPASEAKVDRKSAERGPLLVVSGELDHQVPPAVANATYKKQAKNEHAVTEVVEIPKRGHSLTIDSGWEEVAQTALAFIQRFAP